MEPGTSRLTASAESSEQRKKRRASGEAEREEAKKSKQDYSPEKSTGETPLGTSDPNASEYIQMVVTGPQGCGKSSLVLSWLRESNPHYEGNRLVFNKQHLIEVDSKRCMIWDLDTRFRFEQYRFKSYEECDITFLCFHNARREIKDRSNSDLYRLLSVYINEFKYIRQDSAPITGPIILVGIEKDGDSESHKFSEEEVNYLRGVFKNIKSYKQISTRSNASIDILKEAINLVKHPKAKEMFAKGGFEVSGFQHEVTSYLCD